MASLPSRPSAQTTTFPVGKRLALPSLQPNPSSLNSNNNPNNPAPSTSPTTPSVYLVRLSQEVATALTSNADATILFSSEKNGTISIPKMNDMSFQARPINNAQDDSAYGFCLSRRGQSLRTVGPIIADLDISSHRHRIPPDITAKKRILQPTSTTNNNNNNNLAQSPKVKPIDNLNLNANNNTSNNNSKAKRPRAKSQSQTEKKRPRPGPKRPLTSQPPPPPPSLSLTSKPIDSQPVHPFSNFPLLPKPKPLSQPTNNINNDSSPSKHSIRGAPPNSSSPLDKYNHNSNYNHIDNNHNPNNNYNRNSFNNHYKSNSSEPTNPYGRPHHLPYNGYAPPPPPPSRSNPPPRDSLRSAPAQSSIHSPSSPNISPNGRPQRHSLSSNGSHLHSGPPHMNGGPLTSSTYPKSINSNVNFHNQHRPTHPPPAHNPYIRPISNGNGNNSGGSGGSIGSAGSGTPSGLGGISKRRTPTKNSFSGMKSHTRVSPSNGPALPQPTRRNGSSGGKHISPAGSSRGPSPPDANGSLNRHYGNYNGYSHSVGMNNGGNGTISSPESPRVHHHVKPEQRTEMRRHVIHLLAAGERTIDSLRKTLKIDEACSSEKELYNMLNSIIDEIGDRRPGNEIHLRQHFWIEVHDDYSGWSESQKAKVRMTRASIVGDDYINNNNSNNNNHKYSNAFYSSCKSNSNNRNSANNSSGNSINGMDSNSMSDEALDEEINRFESEESFSRKNIRNNYNNYNNNNNSSGGEDVLRKKFAQWYPVYRAMVGKMEYMRKLFSDLEKKYTASGSKSEKDCVGKKIKVHHEKLKSRRDRMEKNLPAVHEFLKDIKKALDDHAARDCIPAPNSLAAGVP